MGDLSAKVRILFVEDEEDVRMASTQTLELAGFAVDSFENVEQARRHIVPGARAIVLCDVKLPGMNGVDWQRQIRAIDPNLPVILVTGHGDIAMAVAAMRDGAYDFLEKPFPSELLVSVVRRAAEKRALTLQVHALREELDNWHGIEAVLIGRSPQMEEVRRTVLRLAATSADVVIYGETGTGKDLVARCLHDHGSRRSGRFVPLNCGGLPEALAESELFGHEMGAFTGAVRGRMGKFEYAHNGTLFLDEIESMPMAVQIKLLRALQDRHIERVGTNTSVAVDCRVIAASKEDLKLLSDRREFRSDLYYRIGVAFITLPPLRERREDIPMLFEHFVLLAARRYERAAPTLTSEQLAELMAYGWPGNVRELRNVADRLVLGVLGDGLSLTGDSQHMPRGLPEQIEQFERAVIADALQRHHGEIAVTAKSLQVPKQTLYDKLRRLRLQVDEFR
jgi:two-component system C4-dicarboxylate transport response regulator DctD